jgi:hypothetical protein
MGESQLFMVLNKMFPTSCVNDMTGQKASGDFMLKRINKPAILIETKDYANNVPKKRPTSLSETWHSRNATGFFSRRAAVSR